jgi:hypothetical protein
MLTAVELAFVEHEGASILGGIFFVVASVGFLCDLAGSFRRQDDGELQEEDDEEPPRATPRS